MRIATWNVNSIKARLPIVTDWVKTQQPDVVLLQEIKCETPAFPSLEFEALGYKTAVKGQKAYNGVAILSKHAITDVVTDLPGDKADEHARYIEATINGLRIASIYAPNGNPLGSEKFTYKLNWLRRFKAHVATLLETEMPLVLGGDYNVIPEPMDARHPEAWKNDALFQPETRALWRDIIFSTGLIEAYRALHPTHKEAYTFWDYQAGSWQRDNGIRIDHFLLSAEAVDRLRACAIDRNPRALEKASDHTPVIVEIA
jgi:exodeoxyribonuclease-3